MSLSVTSTVLVFVVLPAAVALIIGALVVGGSGTGPKAKRYRPGRPYDFTPIWFLSSPSQVTDGKAPATQHGMAIESGAVTTGGRAPQGVTGGASDRW
ncbi:aa3-type cytochrome oxidase subunit CtaJ [Spirilliplanes yamanashiensis]|uniref:aa3-type cytochrome oxidase subunit CtaJ n=1 Tax=Spirilliplanes yamanashiensis TaxID=42233 RepID=UPI0027854EA7|nr:hypothetical protein [Spirilliplanes yamanashiensis]